MQNVMCTDYPTNKHALTVRMNFRLENIRLQLLEIHPQRCWVAPPTPRRCQLDVVDLTETNGEYTGRGCMIAKPIGTVLRGRAVDANHQVIAAKNLTTETCILSCCLASHTVL